MPLFKPFRAYIAKKRAVPKLDAALLGIEKWFKTPLGKQLLEEQQTLLESELSCLFGYHLMQLSVSREIELFGASRISHCFSASVAKPDLADSQVKSGHFGLHSDLDQLPFEDESLDVTILHHVLEFSDNPHQVLKEASRVTIARGYIIVIGFNPISLMGLFKPFAQLFGKSPIWKRNSLRKGRVNDWLKLLDCNTLKSHEALHNVPWQNRSYLDSSRGFNNLMKRWHLPFGNFYCLVARKDRTSMTPIKADWIKSRQISVLPRPAISARTGSKFSVIKGSKPAPDSKS